MRTRMMSTTTSVILQRTVVVAGQALSQSLPPTIPQHQKLKQEKSYAPGHQQSAGRLLKRKRDVLGHHEAWDINSCDASQLQARLQRTAPVVQGMRASVRSQAFHRRVDRGLHGAPLRGWRPNRIGVSGLSSAYVFPSSSMQRIRTSSFAFARQAVRGWRRLVPPAFRMAWPEEILFVMYLECCTSRPTS